MEPSTHISKQTHTSNHIHTEPQSSQSNNLQAETLATMEMGLITGVDLQNFEDLVAKSIQGEELPAYNQ